ncbi:MAG: ATP-grasp domain-containing protein, partial [Clostridia bacterium]|nr:ATP-grasp domain-containing protein [Clostridia bacterium]
KDVAKIDVAVPCFHGINGEDGSISGLLQLSNIPYTTGSPMACGLTMDKVATKTYLKGLGLSQLPYVVFRSQDDPTAYKLLKRFDFPFIVKPSTQGSSIGIKVANNLEELNSALNVAFCYDTKVVVEKALTDFFEVNCSATRINGVVDTSEIEKPISKTNLLTFADKYLQNGKEGCERIFPYQFDQTEKIKNITKRIYESLDFEGIIRIDFLICNKTNKIYVNEINSIPGSLAFYLWKDKFTHKNLLEQTINQVIATKKRKDNLVYAYKTDLLKIYSNSIKLKFNK